MGIDRGLGVGFGRIEEPGIGAVFIEQKTREPEGEQIGNEGM